MVTCHLQVTSYPLSSKTPINVALATSMGVISVHGTRAPSFRSPQLVSITPGKATSKADDVCQLQIC